MMHYTDELSEMSLELAAGHNIGFAMHKYLLLQNQHEELRQHMHDLCPSYTTSSTAVTSPSVSPTRSFTGSPSMTLSPFPSRSHRRSSLSMKNSGYRCSQTQLEPVLDESLIEEMAAGEQKLFDVNEGIKRALTELLNCETIRKDQEMRTWVQTRLMDTERELRSGRRRRSHGGFD
ncbi:uncharacterized protein GGS22DRAFT_86922 [Annulohypoxylon maeteangense]|uniref:uncharacterized protein n=1 Tax=Annulohypoxylon maeteangense TaxID=1927788 RepID=UPI0020083690|nr:uncharacterized protein GGS22DRAFT_86922 [Annulohypoxylon maeteangense]KAI0880209.1 hypothetical protein GGS22DRAFT_86922 [Annulohypoxylon maeteangense]